MSRAFAPSLARQADSIAVYLRVSSDEQRERATIETQRQYAAQYINLHHLKLHHIYADDGVSGTLPLAARPAGAQLLKDAAAGHFKTLYVYRCDRLARSAIETLKAVEQIEQYGVRFVSMSEPGIDTSTPSGKLILTMLAAAAQHERDSLVERSELGMQRAAREGRAMGGLAPYGYRVQDGRWVIYEPEAEIVRLIFESYVRHDSARHVAKLLDERGTPAPKGNGWAAGTIIKFLRSEAYAGRRAWRKRHQRRGADGRMRAWKADKEDESSWIYADCPAVISRELWELAEAQRKENLKGARRNSFRTYLLRGKIICGNCNYSYTGHTRLWTDRFGETREYVSYHCGSRTTTSAKRGMCRNPSVSGARLESLVWDDILSFLKRPETIIKRLETREAPRRKKPDSIRERSRLEKALAAKLASRKRIVDALSEGVISHADAKEKIGKLETETLKLEAEVELLTDRAAEARMRAGRARDAAAALAEMSDGLEAFDEEKRHFLIRLLVDEICVTVEEKSGKPESFADICYVFEEPRAHLSDSDYRGSLMFSQSDKLTLRTSHSLRKA